jgi:hypothetical protein
LRRRRKIGRHWMMVLRSCHILGRSWSEQKCAEGALLRPGQQTYCAILKLNNGGDGHFQAKAAVPCLTSFGGFMPYQSQSQSRPHPQILPNHQVFASTMDAGMRQIFFQGGMSNGTPGFPTPYACNCKDHSATVVIAMQQHHRRSTFVALLANCNHIEEIYKTLR